MEWGTKVVLSQAKRHRLHGATDYDSISVLCDNLWVPVATGIERFLREIVESATGFMSRHSSIARSSRPDHSR